MRGVAVSHRRDRPGEDAMEHNGLDVAILPQIDQLIRAIAKVVFIGTKEPLNEADRLEVLRGVVQILRDLRLPGQARLDEEGRDRRWRGDRDLARRGGGSPWIRQAKSGISPATKS